MRQSTSNKNPECPAIAELADTLEANFPNITLLTTNDASPGTRHTAGLAIDIMLDVTNDGKKEAGSRNYRCGRQAPFLNAVVGFDLF